jgi:hypothetical protein
MFLQLYLVKMPRSNYFCNANSHFLSFAIFLYVCFSGKCQNIFENCFVLKIMCVGLLERFSSML